MRKSEGAARLPACDNLLKRDLFCKKEDIYLELGLLALDFDFTVSKKCINLQILSNYFIRRFISVYITI